MVDAPPRDRPSTGSQPFRSKLTGVVREPQYSADIRSFRSLPEPSCRPISIEPIGRPCRRKTQPRGRVDGDLVFVARALGCNLGCGFLGNFSLASVVASQVFKQTGG